MASCDTKTGTCESTAGSHEQYATTSCESKCICGGGCGGDPVACSMILWKCAFKEAMKQVMVDALKPKLQKMMGPKADKASDAVLEAMFAKWQSMIATEEAKTKLKDKLHSIMTEGK
jgi:hypothetical protein